MDNNLLSGLKSVGLENLADIELFEKTEVQDNVKIVELKEVQKNEKDILFDKTYNCPVCQNAFKSKMVKTGKNKLVSVDSDLRPIYKDADAIKYDSIVCNKCGYSALTRYFPTISLAQAKLILSSITPTFKGINNEVEEFTYDDALLRHQLALVCAVIKKGSDSEKAYICLKLAWLIRGKQEKLEKAEKDYDSIMEKLKSDEQDYVKKAYQGFTAAMNKERFPICGMDDMKYIYLCADLARRCKEFQTSSKLVSEILVSKTAGNALKNKARDLFDLIKEDIKIYGDNN